MKRLFLILVILVQGAIHGVEPLVIPDEFTVTQRWLSFTSDFDVQSEDHYIGYIHRKFFSPVLRYDFNDDQGDLLATAKMQYYTWGSIVKVTDSSNNPLGVVEIRYANKFEYFDIINAEGKTLIVGSLNFMVTNFILTDPITEVHMADLTRSYFAEYCGRGKWTFRVIAPEVFHNINVDSRLFIVAMGILSDRNYWRDPPKKNDVAAPVVKGVTHNPQGLVKADFDTASAVFDEMFNTLARSNEDKEKLGEEVASILLNGDQLTPQQKQALSILLRKRESERE